MKNAFVALLVTVGLFACNSYQSDDEFKDNVFGVSRAHVLVDGQHKVMVEHIRGKGNVYAAMYAGTLSPTRVKSVVIKAIEQAGNCEVDRDTFVDDVIYYVECNKK